MTIPINKIMQYGTHEDCAPGFPRYTRVSVVYASADCPGCYWVRCLISGREFLAYAEELTEVKS